MEVWIRNLATDEEFSLDLPMTNSKLNAILEKKLGDSDYRIADSDDIEINEMVSISTINDFCQAVENCVSLDKEDIYDFVNYYSMALDDAADILNDENFVFYEASNYTDLALIVMDELGYELPEWAEDFFDYEAFGEAFSTNNGLVETTNGFIDVDY
jgi:hypothetical protein